MAPMCRWRSRPQHQERTSVERTRMSVNSPPPEGGLPGSRRVDHHADGLDDDWGVADHDVVSRVRVGDVRRAGHELRELVSQQYVLSRPVHGRGRWAAHSTIAVALTWLRLMTALVRYRIRLVAELNHRVRGFDAGRQERRQEHERAFGRPAVRHHRSDGPRPPVRYL